MTVSCDMTPRILIADDQPDLLDALKLLLKGQGIEYDAVTSPDAAVRALESRPFDLVLMDLNYTGDTTSGREGIDLLARVQALDRLLPVIVMTGWGSVDLAVEAMRRGVRDFVQKPWDNAHLLATLRQEIEAGRARRREEAAEQRELVGGAADPDAPAAAAGAADRRLGARRLVAAGVRRRRRLLRHDPLQRHAPRAHDRRRRRQRHPGGAADVEPAGGGARFRVGSGRSRRRSAIRSTGSCAATLPKGASSASSTACSTRPAGVLTYTNAGHYLPMLVRDRRLGRTTRHRRPGARRALGSGLRAGSGRRSARAIGSCCSPTA